ncbi:hypothetical protein DFS34DRAFT_96584 [Phlyctochytrium arcticum]|nr:hypothetical protein DFS34DRAFT_335026 [Phlyctochytrium arcticum]KAI9098062.1 hypothetical protein DFS34DRAFT_96584 [Phlyctochytrium arcticum]
MSEPISGTLNHPKRPRGSVTTSIPTEERWTEQQRPQPSIPSKTRGTTQDEDLKPDLEERHRWDSHHPTLQPEEEGDQWTVNVDLSDIELTLVPPTIRSRREGLTRFLWPGKRRKRVYPNQDEIPLRIATMEDPGITEIRMSSPHVEQQQRASGKGKDGSRKLDGPIILRTATENDPSPELYSASTSAPHLLRATPQHRSPTHKFSATTSSLANIWRHSIRETSRHKSQFCIGCSSVCLVVFAAALLITVIGIMPIVFLSIAERNSGETDLTISPRWGSGFNRLNYTAAKGLLSDGVSGGFPIQYSTPRIADVSVTYYKADGCAEWDSTVPRNTEFTYTGPTIRTGDDAGTQASKQARRNVCSANTETCISTECTDGEEVSTWVIDSPLEKKLQIGRGWKSGNVPVDGLLISENTAQALNVAVGDWVILKFSTTLFQNAIEYVRNATITGPFTNIDTVNVPLRISATFSDTATNKFPQWVRGRSFGIIEYSTALEALAPYFHPSYPPAFRSSLVQASRSGMHYAEASQLVFACGIPRHACYMTSNIGQVARNIIRWGTTIRFRLGLDAVTGYFDTMDNLRGVSTFSQFLSLIATIVVALFVGLSCFLIYNLLMVSVETRTFELGIMRMIGQTRWGVIQMILVQAISYSLPAWAIGLVLCQILFIVGKRFLENIATITLSPLLPPEAIIAATVLGTAVPMLAAILPIRQALAGNLRNALDKRHSKVKPIIVTIERSGPGSVAEIVPMACTGALLTALTFMIYYLVPKALLENNLTLLFNIFIGLLLGMLFGMVILSYNVQPTAERLFLSFLMMLAVFENKATHPLVVQNLVAHRLRNRKTATMFSFALAFVIFLSVNLSVEMNAMEFNAAIKIGGQIRISTSNTYGIPRDSLASIESILEQSKPLVLDWAVTSWSMRQFENTVEDTLVANLGRIVQYPVDVVAVSPNFLNLPEPRNDLLLVGESDPKLDVDYPSISEQLYSQKGFRSAILPTILRKNLAFSTLSNGQTNFTDVFLLTTKVATSDSTSANSLQLNVLQPCAFLDSAPYSTMTKFPITRRVTLFVSFPTLLQLSNGRLGSVQDIALRSIHIGLDTSLPRYKSQLAQLLRSLNGQTRGTDMSIADLGESLNDIQSSRRLLSTIFNLATVLVVLIMLFSLNGCMYTNIMEQSKEIGVLRALGVTRWTIFRLYTYEAFTLTCTSGILGTLIGGAVGWSIAAQRAIMTQIPIGFPFPWEITIVVIAASVVSALVSTAGPVYGLVAKRKIVSILRE